MITLDGTFGEGGGQIIRTAMSLAAITKNSLTIHNIRAKRPKPGLMAQHITACHAISSLCQGRLIGAALHSETLTFHPGNIKGGEYEFKISTAGSTILVAQCIIPPLLIADKPSHVLISGGTHIIKSPGYDYFKHVFIPAIQHLGAKVSAKLLKPGFFPKGGGLIELTIEPSTLIAQTKWSFENDSHAIIRLSKLPSHIALREQEVLAQRHINDITIDDTPATSPGNVITLWHGYNGVNLIGEQGTPAEVVAKQAVDELSQENAAIDRHLADQLLIYAAIAKGATQYQTSLCSEHLRTNAEIIKQFIPKKIAYQNAMVKIA